MKDLSKAIVLTLIWIGCVVVSIVSATNNVLFGATGDASMAIVFPLVVALLATFAIYGFPEMMQAINRGQERDRNHLTPEKGKRLAGDDKLALLLSMMDEDEKDAFKDALKRQMLARNRSPFEDGELSDDAEVLTAMLDEDASSARMH